MNACKKHTLKLIGLLLTAIPVVSAQTGVVDLTGKRLLNWRTDQITQVIAGGNYIEGGTLVTMEGRQCMDGSRFNFNVDDGYAFDIDETVQLEIEFYLHANDSTAYIAYEKNGDGELTQEVRLPAYQGGSHGYKKTFTLDRARFANRSWFGSDFVVGIGGKDAFLKEKSITICGVSLKRSYETPNPEPHGYLTLEITDETGKPTPARVGLYDASGRFPLPSEDAVTLKRFSELVRTTMVDPNTVPWPVRNPSAFYVNGTYRAKLPAGRYDLVIAKGPEYRIGRTSFTVDADRTRAIKLKLRRWDDLPAKGWFSGDDHIHSTLGNANDNRSLLLLTEAEDVHVANVLQAGNIARALLESYDWQPLADPSNPSYVIIPGLEDPRSFRHGHSLHLNLRESVRPAPDRYLLYHEVFAKARELGAVTGYAHVAVDKDGPGTRGMALDVPFGLVDIAEVLQFGTLNSNLLFDFLNMGYKIAPSAGTDYPDARTPIIPGVERTYVRVEKPFTSKAWFDALKRGESFVTTGPMLDFTVNSQGMGSELHLRSGQKLIIDAQARINPDIDSLDRLELIEQGEVVKTVRSRGDGKTELELHYEGTARHGTWFVVRAFGKQPPKPRAATRPEAQAKSMALSGAVYVYVDGKSFWKPSAMPLITERFKQHLKRMLISERDQPELCCELWETREPSLRYWDGQKGLLEERVHRAIALYDDLARRAAASDRP